MVLVGTFFLFPSLEDPDYVPVGLNLSSIALGALLFYGVNGEQNEKRKSNHTAMPSGHTKA